MKYHYIKSYTPGVVTFDNPLNPEIYALGATYEDYLNDLWVLLNDEQAAFAAEHPNASVDEVWKCALHPVPERTIDDARNQKIMAINNYDASPAVNSFTLQGSQLWLDKATRVGLANSISIEKAAGRSVTNLWLGDTRYTLNISIAEQMLAALELYALDCYNVTAEHRHTVNQLTTIEEIDEYNHTVGYPEHLNLDALTA